MPGQRIQQQIQDEFPEMSIRGPFGGVQSEMPPDAIERLGFLNVSNFYSRKSVMQPAAGYQSLLAQFGPQTGPVLGAYDFFDAAGTRHQVVAYQGQLYEWVGGIANPIATASGPTGDSSDYFAFADVNYTMCYTQGVDTIQLWSGTGATTAPSQAPSAKYLMELATHLIAGYITSGVGAPFPSMYMYSGADDPTDWTSFDSGVYNLANELGPIRGLGKVDGIGYSLHHFGLNQIYPTGNAQLPFYNFGVASKGKGCPYPYGAAYWGDEAFFWPGESDIYMFEGQNIEPIGAKKIDGNRQVGARSAIMSELRNANPGVITGATTSVINGNDFNAYWLVIPNGSTWIYNIDEESWTRRVYDKTPTLVSRFYNPATITIAQLVGTIAQQSWTFDSLNALGFSDDLFVGFNDGTPGLVDYSLLCETEAVIASGQLIAGDRRHNKLVKNLRVSFIDNGAFTFFVQFMNEKNQQQEFQITWSGSGTGAVRQVLVPCKLNGVSITYSIELGPLQNLTIVELAHIYDTSGEEYPTDDLTVVEVQ
jgi:hypothetical protein